MSHVTSQGSKAVRVKAPTAPRRLPQLRDVQMPRDGLEDDAILKGIRYGGTLLAGLSAEAVEAEGCHFDSVRFTGTELRGSQISDSIFDTCDFAQFRAQDVSLIRCKVSGSRFTGSSWKSGTFRDVRFETCRSDTAMFRHSKLYSVIFSDCRMPGADFQWASMHNVRFENCDLAGAQFANVETGTIRFENCTLIDVGGVANLKGAAVQGPGSMELALSLAREVGITFEP